MEIMSKHGINVPQNGVASTLAEVDSVLSNVIGGFSLHLFSVLFKAASRPPPL